MFSRLLRKVQRRKTDRDETDKRRLLYGMNEHRQQAPVPLTLAQSIAEGRGALSGSRRTTAGPAHESRSTIRLLELLWHEQKPVRRSAALALAGGDAVSTHTVDYGHFPTVFLVMLDRAAPCSPADAAGRFDAVVIALQLLLEQHLVELRGLCSMQFSFLSGGLYLALLATCHETIAAVRRLKAADLHPELCHLLHTLSELSRNGRINPQHITALAAATGGTLAALSPGEIPQFWHELSSGSAHDRLDLLPVVGQIGNRLATPFLLTTLHGQQSRVAAKIIEAIGRTGNSDTLETLSSLTHSRDRAVRRAAQSAITHIRREAKSHPSRTLLRPHDESQSHNLLRPATERPEQQHEELLRPS